MGLLVSGGGVSNTLCLYTDKQSDIEVIIAAVLALGRQDKDLHETLPDPMHGIHHKKAREVCCGTNSINSVAIYQ